MTKCYRITRSKNPVSRFFDWSNDRVPVRKFAVLGTDITGYKTVTYTIVERESDEACDAEMSGQLTDGWFENDSYDRCSALPSIPPEYLQMYNSRMSGNKNKEGENYD